MLVRLVQPLNARHPIELALTGMVMLSRLLHSENVALLIDVRPSERVILVKLLQP